MEYHTFTEKEKDDWIQSGIPESTVKLSKSKKDLTYYAVNQIGINPLLWQKVAIWDKISAGQKRIAVCTGRQAGKSMAVGVLALWAAKENIFPAGLTKKTHVGIVSATEEQSKKLMAEIKRVMIIGDQHVEKITKGKVKKYFTGSLDSGQSATNNKTTITFNNGNQIVCLPPTNRVRGYSFSYMVVDEAAFLEDNDIFFDSIEPTVAQTNGTIVLTSTPNGQQGFYYDVFDPEDKYDTHEYDRFWLHYERLGNEDMIEAIKAKKILYYATGKERHFQQEYDALFTTQVSAFFESVDVDNMFMDGLVKVDEYKGQCDLSVDFGMVNSHTVITVSRLSKDDQIERLWHYRYNFGTDDKIIEDIEGLLKRFNVQRIIPDDCPEGYYVIQQMEEKGWNVKPMSFKRDKVSKYVAFRSWLRQKKIHSYKDTVLEQEMKAMQEEETPRSTKICKPYGGTDDEIDSFIMSCYFFLEPKTTGFKFYDLSE